LNSSKIFKKIILVDAQQGQAKKQAEQFRRQPGSAKNYIYYVGNTAGKIIY
jgi:hypothetical protein